MIQKRAAVDYFERLTACGEMVDETYVRESDYTPRKALKKHTVPRVSPVKICARCKQPMPSDRYPNARYCVPCSTLQRKEVQHRHDKKRAAVKREKAKTPESRAANRKSGCKVQQNRKRQRGQNPQGIQAQADTLPC